MDKTTDTLNATAKIKQGLTVTSKADDLIPVYRGTNGYMENRIYEETGHLMSDATRRAYMETGSLDKAYKATEPIHKDWLKIWGDENTYVQAHGEFGTELPQAFGLDRTMMSVTTDPSVAKRFAGKDGIVYKSLVPKSQLIPQTIEGAGESEYLIKYGFGGFKK